ncbi:MAG: aromatic ring-hydroxylating dioxygenase subunit alpha [Candidatus Eisenbacteria bacterium]|nr:aromatic ring-hydroxylating dioxygenase subunit alpha [Candidatus Eisenbacteria bacterium]MCC7140631.1 aromatic ring-hydroxylating dioxygenase subunit alpha [Candidatus Eisenbacteria bacterium]
MSSSPPSFPGAARASGPGSSERANLDANPDGSPDANPDARTTFSAAPGPAARRTDSPLALRAYWYIAARSRELRRKPLPRTLLGEPIVLFRRDDGSPAALEDRCAHRNLALARGCVRRGTLECAYHGWRYDAAGRCVDIPALVGEADRPDIRIRSYPACEADGFIWVYFGAEPPAGPPRPFPHHREPGWMSFLLVNRFEAGAYACLENFLDCPHTVYVHTGWFRSKRARELRAKLRDLPDGYEAEFVDERNAQSVVSRLLFPRGSRLIHTDRFLMPTTSRVDYRFGDQRHYVITSQCTPVTETETMVYTMVTFRFDRRGLLGPFVRLYFEPIARHIIRQDVAILRAQSMDIRRFGSPRFRSTAADLLGPQILRLWRAENHRRPTDPSVTAPRLGGTDRTTAEGTAPSGTEVILRF